VRCHETRDPGIYGDARANFALSLAGKRKKKIDPINSAMIDADKVERGWVAVRKHECINDFRKFDEIDNGNEM